MHIALLGATRRGYLFLQKLLDLAPNAELTVFSFPEDPWEPRFLSDIRELTTARNQQFFEARQVGAKRWRPFWGSTPVDLMFVVSWRYLIPSHVYKAPRLGTFVFHDSLLPAYRGFSPTVWAMVNGEDHTGVTMFEIVKEVDAGDIIDQQRVPISSTETIKEVLDRVTQTYLDLLEKNLERLLNGSAPRYPQDHTLATFTCKRLPEDNEIDWTNSAGQIHNLIRAVTKPYPGAYTWLSDQKIQVWSAERLPATRRYVGRVPGRVVEVRPGEGTVVLAGNGGLLLKAVQREDGDVVCASELLKSPSQTLGRR